MAGQRGFSLIELIVSIGIIGTSLILVIGIFAYLVAGGQKASDLTSGTVAADGLLSQEIYQIMSVTNTRNQFFLTSYSTPYLLSGGTYQLNNTVYFYKIYCQDAPLTGTAFTCLQIYGGSSTTSLKQLDIVVWWDDAAAASVTQVTQLGIINQTVGMGVLQVHQMRLLWPTGTY